MPSVEVKIFDVDVPATHCPPPQPIHVPSSGELDCHIIPSEDENILDPAPAHIYPFQAILVPGPIVVVLADHTPCNGDS
jgi:hypothetical protein